MCMRCLDGTRSTDRKYQIEKAISDREGDIRARGKYHMYTHRRTREKGDKACYVRINAATVKSLRLFLDLQINEFMVHDCFTNKMQLL